MTIYIRTQNNEDIASCMIFSERSGVWNMVDISMNINIKNYTDIILDLSQGFSKHDFKNDMHEVSELRGWYWETYITDRNDSSVHRKSEIEKDLLEKMTTYAGKYNLKIVTG